MTSPGGRPIRRSASRSAPLREEIGREFGLVPRIAARLRGPIFHWTAIREEYRLAGGLTDEPEPIIGGRNWVSAERPSRVSGALTTTQSGD